jgi:hypothetical protein
MTVNRFVLLGKKLYFEINMRVQVLLDDFPKKTLFLITVFIF